MEYTRLNLLGRWASGIPLALAALTPACAAPATVKLADLGESPDRYADVSVLEGRATIHKGVISEPLTPEVPVAEGDWFESQGRGLLQLGDGTRVAFGDGARIHVAELFGEAKEAREARLKLGAGRIRIRVGDSSDARIRIDTPAGSVTMQDDADVTLRANPNHTLQLWVNEGRAVFSGETQREVVLTGESLATSGDPHAQAHTAEFDLAAQDDFGRWSKPRLVPTQSESASLVPEEIQYFTHGLDGMGQWTLLPRRGIWAWRPTHVAQGWRPYLNGRWESSEGGLTWISSDPGGFVTTHFGRWEWKTSLGWYWIPGAYYSPAWVAWKSADGLFGWAPLDFYNRPCKWGQNPGGPSTSWNIVRFSDLDADQLGPKINTTATVSAAFDRSNGAGQGWFPGRVVVTPEEFHDPSRIQAVVNQPRLLRERIATYEWLAQATAGRTIWRISSTPIAGFESIVSPVTPQPILRGQDGWERATAFQHAFGVRERPLPGSGSSEGTGASALLKPVG